MQSLLQSGLEFQVLQHFEATPMIARNCGCCYTGGLPDGTQVSVQGHYSRTQLSNLLGSTAWVRGVIRQ